MGRIDARTDELIRQTAAEINADVYPSASSMTRSDGRALLFPDDSIMSPPTRNPDAEDIVFQAAEEVHDEEVLREANDALGRLADGGMIDPADAPPGTLVLDLGDALAQSLRTAREFKTAEEEYVLASLRLLIERHQWGPRFFDEVSATVSGAGADNHYDTALRLVNEFGVTQRLPYGGEVSARLLARATEDLHQRVSGENVQDAEIILGANIPLLRGAGLAAREPLIQAERDLIYDARSFERFRRTFLVSIARDFLNLVVQQQAIGNAEMQLRRLIEFAERAEALVESGRSPPFDAARAAQDVLFAEDSLRSQRENYRFAVDRFKIRLGLSADQPVIIVPSNIGLPTPVADVDLAVHHALRYRLDLQNARDQVDDTARGVDIAKNNLLPDLDLTGNVSIPTDEHRDRDGLRFNTEETTFAAGVTFGLPLDREIERLSLRQAQINLERTRRNYEEFRDTLIIEVRDAVREIERSIFSLRLQEENIRIAQLRLDSIDAAPDRADAIERSDAADALTRAQDQRDEAYRDLQVSILEYLLSTGTLRVRPDGGIQPLSGMDLGG